MINVDEIQAARLGIERLFIQYATVGPAVVLKAVDSGASAAGQHLPGRTPQRGLHGTAAAIKVLAQATESATAPTLTRELLHYVTNRLDIEAKVKPVYIAPNHIRQDDANVIKISEVLFALSFVATGKAPREALAHTLADRLVNGRSSQAGWSYLLSVPSTSTAILPTAHAVLALAAHGYIVDGDLAYLRTHLRQSKGSTSQTDISVQVMALYVLAFASKREDEKELASWFRRLWTKLSPLLAQDLEANIEYEVGNSVNYVRVPWQLYLLACASRISPYVCFASGVAQRRMASILESVSKGSGLIYPHSGSDPSTRTNGIVYEVLGRIQVEMDRRRLPLRPFGALDKGRVALTSKWVIVTVRIIVVALIVFSLVRWWQSSDRTVATLAPDFITAFLLLLLTGRKDR